LWLALRPAPRRSCRLGPWSRRDPLRPPSPWFSSPPSGRAAFRFPAPSACRRSAPESRPPSSPPSPRLPRSPAWLPLSRGLLELRLRPPRRPSPHRLLFFSRPSYDVRRASFSLRPSSLPAATSASRRPTSERTTPSLDSPAASLRRDAPLRPDRRRLRGAE